MKMAKEMVSVVLLLKTLCTTLFEGHTVHLRKKNVLIIVHFHEIQMKDYQKNVLMLGKKVHCVDCKICMHEFHN